MYTIGSQGYNIYHKYGIREGKSNINKEVINILYINHNHFNLLLPNDENTYNNKKMIEKNITIKELEKI